MIEIIDIQGKLNFLFTEKVITVKEGGSGPKDFTTIICEGNIHILTNEPFEDVVQRIILRCSRKELEESGRRLRFTSA